VAFLLTPSPPVDQSSFAGLPAETAVDCPRNLTKS
jgi:hypothetical protein